MLDAGERLRIRPIARDPVVEVVEELEDARLDQFPLAGILHHPQRIRAADDDGAEAQPAAALGQRRRVVMAPRRRLVKTP
jgi:hypothetical protein